MFFRVHESQLVRVCLTLSTLASPAQKPPCPKNSAGTSVGAGHSGDSQVAHNPALYHFVAGAKAEKTVEMYVANVQKKGTFATAQQEYTTMCLSRWRITVADVLADLLSAAGVCVSANA